MADKDRQTNGRGDAGGGGGDKDEDGGVGPKEIGDPKERECRKAKRVAFFGFRKGKKKLHQKRKQRINSVNSGCWAKRVFRGGGGGCFLCLKKPETLDSAGESPTSDPNSSEFTVDMLRALIEKNDFYSKECNPHLDTDSN